MWWVSNSENVFFAMLKDPHLDIKNWWPTPHTNRKLSDPPPWSTKIVLIPHQPLNRNIFTDVAAEKIPTFRKEIKNKSKDDSKSEMM